MYTKQTIFRKGDDTNSPFFFCFVYSRAQPDDSLYKAFCMRQPDSKMLTYILYALGVMWILYVLTLDSVPGAAIDGADYSS